MKTKIMKCVCRTHGNACEEKGFEAKVGNVNHVFCCLKGFEQSIADFTKHIYSEGNYMKIKSAEAILAEKTNTTVMYIQRRTTGKAPIITITEAISAIRAYHDQFKSIYAITNIEAEDLGSSIIATYWGKDKAYEELELIQYDSHPEFFAGGILEVFEIKLPII